MEIERITMDMINANIVGEHYFSALDGLVGGQECGPHRDASKGTEANLHLLTFCVLTLKNGFMVHGVSGVADPSKFDAEIGRQVARQNAVNAIWPVMGYALKSHMAGISGL